MLTPLDFPVNSDTLLHQIRFNHFFICINGLFLSFFAMR